MSGDVGALNIAETVIIMMLTADREISEAE